VKTRNQRRKKEIHMGCSKDAAYWDGWRSRETWRPWDGFDTRHHGDTQDQARSQNQSHDQNQSRARHSSGSRYQSARTQSARTHSASHHSARTQARTQSVSTQFRSGSRHPSLRPSMAQAPSDLISRLWWLAGWHDADIKAGRTSPRKALLAMVRDIIRMA